jgi:hypothetical protein
MVRQATDFSIATDDTGKVASLSPANLAWASHRLVLHLTKENLPVSYEQHYETSVDKGNGPRLYSRVLFEDYRPYPLLVGKTILLARTVTQLSYGRPEPNGHSPITQVVRITAEDVQCNTDIPARQFVLRFPDNTVMEDLDTQDKWVGPELLHPSYPDGAPPGEGPLTAAWEGHTHSVSGSVKAAVPEPRAGAHDGGVPAAVSAPPTPDGRPSRPPRSGSTLPALALVLVALLLAYRRWAGDRN